MARAISEEVTVVSQLAPREHRPRSEERGAHLIVLGGHNVGQVFVLSKAQTTIGRDEDSDIQMLDAGISRHHALITRSKEGHYLLQDTGSRNGTFANNQRLEDVHRLNDGDKIQIGVMTILKFAHTDDAETDYAQTMYEAAHRDGLTNAFNRRFFEDKLGAEFPQALRHGRPLALVILDLDHFKQVNDTYGHPAGDHVLRDFAQLVSRITRAEDVLVRYGGEEFAIVCRQTDVINASILGERIRHEVASHEFVVEGQRIKLTASVGIAALPDPAITTPQELVAAADESLYQAKERGRNCVVARRSK